MKTINLSRYKDMFVWKDYPSFKESISNHVITEGADAGSEYDFTRTPYFKAILDDLDDPQVLTIALKCASQIGKTRLLIGIAIEWALRYGGLVLYYTPKHEMTAEIFATKMLPTVLNTPHIEKMLPHDMSGNIKNAVNRHSRRITFSNGGIIEIKQGRTKDAFKSSTASLVIADEYDEICSDRATNAGDLLENLITRTSSFENKKRKVVIASTPVKANFGIEKVWGQSRQFKYNVMCCECQGEWDLNFKDLIFRDKDLSNKENINRIVENEIEVICKCPHCEKIYKPYTKNALTNSGKWIEIDNEEANKKYKAYHISGIHSSRSWGELAIKWIETESDPEKYKQFVQQILAEIKNNKLLSKINMDTIIRGDYKRGQRNSNIYLGIDVQTTKQLLYITALNVIDIEKRLFEICDYEVIDYREDMLSTIVSELIAKYNAKLACIDTGHKANMIYDVIREINNSYGNDVLVGLKGNSSNRSMYFQNDRKLLLIHPNMSNESLDDYILQGKIQFPSDTEIILMKHLQNEIPYEDKNGKITYILRYEHAQNDWRDALRYAMVLSLFDNEGNNRCFSESDWGAIFNSGR